MLDTAGVEFSFIVSCALMMGALVAGIGAIVSRWSWLLFSSAAVVAFVATVIGYSWLEATGITAIREFFRFAFT